MEKEKICLVIPTLTMGGMERVMSELANYLSEKPNVEIHLILMLKKPQFYKLNKKIIVHEPEHGIFQNNKLLVQFSTFFYLRKCIKKIKPKSVLSFGEKYNSIVLFAASFLKVKVFVSDRGNPSRNLGVFHNVLRKFVYKIAYGIICQTDIAKEVMYKRTNHKKIFVIGNPIKRFSIPEFAHKEKVILSVGRLIRTKRFDLLIKIFNQTDFNDWKLLIVGEGPEREKLEDLIDKLGLSENIILYGVESDMTNLLSTSRIFAFTSVSEGFPNALGEAMVSGLASICFNFVAGSTDLVIDNKTGLLIPMGNTKLFAKKLQTLMDDESLSERLGKAGKLHCEQFSKNNIGEKFYNTLTTA